MSNSYTSLPVHFTPKAMIHIKKVLAENVDHLGLRLSIKNTAKSGCAGATYVFEYVSKVEPQDRVFSLTNGVSVFIDSQVLPQFEGSVVDYVKTGFNSKLECYSPHEVARCGCGESVSFG